MAIGLGDYPYPELAGGAPTNAQVVEAVVDLARRHGREVASPAEARERLTPS